MRTAALPVVALCASLAGCDSAERAPEPPLPRAPVAAAADPTDAAVHRIRAHYATIERELPTYRCRTLELDGFSAEGGELQACYAGDQLRKLTARYYGESGRAEEQFFVWNQQLEFVFRADDTYTEPLSGRVQHRAEERFYFVDGKLVRWLGPGNVPRAVRSAEAQEAATGHLTIARQLAACAQDANATRCAA